MEARTNSQVRYVLNLFTSDTVLVFITFASFFFLSLSPERNFELLLVLQLGIWIQQLP